MAPPLFQSDSASPLRRPPMLRPAANLPFIAPLSPPAAADALCAAIFCAFPAS